MAGNQGLSPDSSMDDKKRDKIHSMGGQASHSGGRNPSTGKNDDVITNHSGGGRLDKAAQRKGGHDSHKNE